MSLSGLTVFDETLHVTNVWLKELMGELDTDDRHRAYVALRSTLHALRDRLVPENAVHLGAQLPMLIRGFYYEGWKPSTTPTPDRRKEFLERIEEDFINDPEADPEIIARSVFAVLSRHITQGEARKTVHSLPHEVRALWPEIGTAGNA